MTSAAHEGDRDHLLEAHVVVRRGDLAVDVPLRAAAGEVVAILGPNGAGKTTVLHALAGLAPLHDGHVTVDGESWAGPRQTLTPDQRSVGLLAADHLLFPHLSAWRNVAFGPIARRTRRAAARERAHDELLPSASPTSPTASHARCPTARPSASPWPERWPPIPACSCSTSPCPPSIPAHAPRCERPSRLGSRHTTG